MTWLTQVHTATEVAELGYDPKHLSPPSRHSLWDKLNSTPISRALILERGTQSCIEVKTQTLSGWTLRSIRWNSYYPGGVFLIQLWHGWLMHLSHPWPDHAFSGISALYSDALRGTTRAYVSWINEYICGWMNGLGPCRSWNVSLTKDRTSQLPGQCFLAASHAASEQEGNRDAYILFFIFLLHLILCFALIKKAQ